MQVNVYKDKYIRAKNAYKNLEKDYKELVDNYNGFKKTVINSIKNYKGDGDSDYDVGYNTAIEHAITVVEDMNVPLIFDDEKPQFLLTRLEYELLKFWNDKEFKYIARDSNDLVFVYREKPSKKSEVWGSVYGHRVVDEFYKSFLFVKWEDSEPTSIQEVLENCEVIESD